YGTKDNKSIYRPRGFTKEPEDSESKESPARDKSWKFSELKRRTSSINEGQLKYIWKIGIKLMIEMDVLVTKTFIDKVQEIKEMDEEEKELKIKEWLERETVICRRCGNRRFEMNKMDSECEECIQEMQKDEQDELAELKDELEKLGYEVDVSEIRRIKGFGVNNRIMITKEFIKEYMKIIDLEDKEVRKEIHKWLNENTTWCEGCEIRWMNN
ncbi:20108_t:CDS:2, partial [Rhizophagus irregularis]